MKRTRVFWLAVASVLTAILGSAMAGRAENPAPSGQQDAAQQAKRDAELAIVLPDGAEGQESRQKVVLELIAADAQVVKGKPYSADTSTETVQTLTDGNRIVHRTVSKFYRDSEGRTRREQTFGDVDPEHPSLHEVKVFIDDPVSESAWVLDPRLKSVEKVQRSRKFLDERSAADDDGPRNMFYKFVKDGEDGVQDNSERMMIKFKDEHLGDANTPAMIVRDDKREEVKEDLGSKNIEGVDCTGTRRTITIPAGAVGNEKPILIVTETWFAPAIGVVVQSTTDDPRFGKTTYQLTNVQTSEPARSLFEPPPDFKMDVQR